MAGITWWNLGDGTAVKGENKALGGLIDEKFDPKASYRVLDGSSTRSGRPGWRPRPTHKARPASAASAASTR